MQAWYQDRERIEGPLKRATDVETKTENEQDPQQNEDSKIDTKVSEQGTVESHVGKDEDDTQKSEEAMPTFLPLSEHCSATLEAEALERLQTVIAANFKTARGLIVLESDLALYDGDGEVFVTRMREEYSSRLHSLWLDEFCEALQIWVASRL